MSKLSIIIPIYFNEDTLMMLYQDLKEKVLCKLEDYEIVMVDDGSGDNSWEVIKEISELDNRVIPIKLSRNFGSHAAILAGYANCTGDCGVVKAADLQEDSELILRMYGSWKNGNKVVLAAREEREEGFFQKLFANTYYTLMRKFVMKSMPKGGFDCFLIDRNVIEVLKLLDEKNSAITLQILWSGFKTDIIYYVRKKREIGKSRWTLSKKIKLVIDSMMSFSYFPVRFISGFGAVSFIISALWGMLLVLNKLFNGSVVSGWTTIVVLLLLSFGIIMLTLGILGEYIWRILDASRNRPPYIIDEIKEDNIC